MCGLSQKDRSLAEARRVITLLLQRRTPLVGDPSDLPGCASHDHQGSCTAGTLRGPASALLIGFSRPHAWSLSAPVKFQGCLRVQQLRHVASKMREDGSGLPTKKYGDLYLHLLSPSRGSHWRYLLAPFDRKSEPGSRWAVDWTVH